MSIFHLIQKIKDIQQKNAPAILMPSDTKDKLNKQLLLELHAQKQKCALNDIDADGNNLLHAILQIAQPDIECIRFILENAPKLADEVNRFSQRPCDILWETENKTQMSYRPLKALLAEHMDKSFVKEILNQECNICLLERFPSKENDDGVHYRTFRTDDLKNIFKRPTLLCFPGRYAFNAKEANGLAKFIRQQLYIEQTDTPEIQILSAWYPGNTLDLGSDLYAFMSPYIKYDNDSPFEYVRRFVNNSFKPLYIDEDGYRLPVSEAAKNMRMVNLFGYSYGGAVIQMIANELSKDMKKAGYSEKERRFIQSQVCVLTVGYYGNVNNYKNDFSCYHLLHMDDRAAYDTLSAAIEKKRFFDLEYYISNLKHQQNQKILMLNGLPLDCTQDPHNIKNYFETPYPSRRHTIMNSWKDCILINALNNSVRNAQNEDFKILSSDLTCLPERIEYVSAEEEKRILSILFGNYQKIEYPQFKIRHEDFCCNTSIVTEKTRI